MTTPDVRPLLKKALLRIEVLEDTAAKREAEKSEPIAVVGLACRFPGGGSNPEAFWQALENGVDAVRRTPEERWAKSTMSARDLEIQWASLLDEFQSFDASFFGISPREASQLDPQQRLVLEVVWEALESAGQDVHRLNGSKTGVFIGQSAMDYALLLNEHQSVDMYSSTGTNSSTTAGRVAFTFGFQGTCMTLDTACSSTLVAIHLACQSLRQKENDLALAGGVNLILHPYTTSVIIKMKALSPDGRCKTFDSRANGFVRGEGCGVLALKRLSDAERDGDPIFAVIRGSAINHDGRSTGLTAPNMLAQRSMLRAALENARLKPEDIGYVETHGTGTALGDPIEFEALRHVIGQPRADGSTCVLGAVKTNVGHLEAAAGAAGIIKVIGALQRERIPKNLHFERLNPHISLEGTSFVIANKQLPWTSKDKPRRAGVSSFGISGTNAHVILEQPPKDTRTPSTRQEGQFLITLSAKTEEARLATAKAHAENLSTDNADSLADFAFSTNARRTHHEYRLAVVGASKKDLAASLQSWVAGDKPADVVSGQIHGAPKLVFVFSGQGSQWIGMGRQLLIEEPAFRDALQACDAALRPHAGFSILEELAKPEATSRLNETEIAQPALFALEVALAKLFQTWGISPQMVIGHSVGEISAAHVAGILDLDQAARLVAIRARIMQKATGHGKMVSVALDEIHAQEALRGFEQRVGIAAVNDSGSVVLSGDTETINRIVEGLAARGVDHRPLRVNYAFHSPQMDPLRDEFTATMGRLSPSAATIPMISTVTGAAISGEKLDTTYWGNNIRQTVRLADAVGLACKTSNCTFVEIGPHAVLAASISQTIATNNSESAVIPTLRRDKDERKQALLALGALHVQGCAIQWSALFPGGGRVVTLPTYPWQKQRYWLESTAHKADLRSAGLSSAEHPWLAAITHLADGDGLLLTGRLSLSEQPWLADHAVFDSVLVPGTGLLELAFAGARAVGQTSLSDFTLEAPLLLPRQGGVRIQLVIQSADAAGRRSLSLFSQAEESPADARWTRNATGILVENPAGNNNAELAVWPPPGAQAVAIADLYSSLSARGYQYGPAFQGLTEVWRRGDVLFARAILPEALRKDAGEYGLHPALLDAALHALFTDGDPENENVRLPFAFSDVLLVATGSNELRVRIELPSAGAQGQPISLTIADGSGQPVARVGGLQVRPATAEQVRASLQSTSRDIYRVDWKPIGPTENPTPIQGWILGGDGRLAKELGLGWISNIEALREKLDRNDSAPERLVVDFTTAIADEMPLPALVQRETALALATLQSLLAEPRLSKTALIWLTHRTVATNPDDPIEDLARAALWGLIRSARRENPDRDLRLIDIDTLSIPPELLAHANEPELVLRDRAIFAARLVIAPNQTSNSMPVITPMGTTLITGGTGELGQSLATHLVQKHGAKHLILTSRRGANAPGAETLVKALKEAGAETVTLAACDVAKEEDVIELIQSIPSDKPLRAVFHLAGVVDDGLLTGLTEERLANTLRPKVAGAWNLHQCTKSLDVSTFVMFSSVAGVIGNAGQANYAAANTFLDILAAHRRQKGLAGQSLAWGLWEQQGLGMTAHLSAADLARMGRQGFSAISVDTGMALLDAASMRTEAALVPIRIDLPTMQKAYGERGPIPALLRGLIQLTLRRVGPTAAAAQALRQSLQGLSENARRNAVLDLIRREIAAVIGLASADAVPIQQPLQTLGLDSLMAVELRNRLSARAETTLPPTLAFDYPTPDAIAGLLLRKAFADLETSATARVAQAHFDEPIAIVGMACRTPGGISDPEGFWTLLDSGRDATGPFPNRWDADTLYDPNPDAIGKSLTREGGFLDDIAGFDAAFFGISPREALAMDPQQRLVLETAWEALERARINPNGLNESLTGVYLGSMGLDYGLGTHSLEALDGYRGMGTASSILAGRLAYILGLQGPAMTIDTACSSSLVAMHLAATGLRQGECDLALAGGVHVMCTPSTFVEFSRLRGLSPDGRCKSFSAGADGVGWAEGCGVLVLKRLSDAKRDGNQVLAVLRGSAVNQDGRSNGLTAPNGPSQQRVIRRALATSALLPADIDALEAHGTGTTLGDPIEAGALIEVFGPTRRQEMPLWLGSSKSNIGHSQAAAGVLGVMKMVLALQHERLPRTLHAEQPTPHIPWERSGLRLLQETQPWQRSPDRIRRAGISSFGLSGTNAHVILEEAPVPSLMPDAPARSAELVVLSAKTVTALERQVKRFFDFLTTHAELALRDLAYSLATTRSLMDHRLAIAATSREGLLGTLQDIIRGQTPADAIRGTSGASKSVKVVFVFSGQGSQWVGMSRQLYREEPVFRDAFAACAETIRKEAGFSILEELNKPEKTSRIHETIVAQPALFAIEVALAGLLQSWGVSPSAVVGHSVGEIAAAHIAGILDLAEAARLVCIRARIMQKATGHGKMVSVSLDEPAAKQAITGLEDRVGIAAINDPHSVVLSGDSEAIDSLIEKFTRLGIQTRPLRVNYAFHSPQMEPLVAEFVEALKTLSVNPATIPMFSTVTGKPVAEGELDVAYWGRNIRQAVRFADAIMTSNERVFVEVGPHPVLAMSIEQTTSAKNGDCKIIPTLRRDRDERKHALLAVGALHTHGIAIDWKAIFPDGGRTVELPTYPWQHERYWLERTTTKKTVAAQVYDGFNTLIQATGENERWETYLTFGPLRDIVPGFSWMSWSVDADLPQQHREIVLDAQRDMRRLLFRHVDFGSCKRVLDFGCGYATDLMVLAKRHSHLQFDGYTISSEQAASDRRRVAQAGLDPRITIYNRDSAKDEFPGQYDVVFGFEVAHHIRDKNALFDNISRHLVEGGALVLADFISNGSFQIEHEETSSFFLTKEEWVDVLSPNGLEIVDCIDISQEVANFLHDPDFDAKLAQASQDVLTRYSRSALVSYDRLGKTLRRGWTSYILLSVRKNSNLSSAELAQRNQAALAELIPYEVANPGPPRSPLEKWLFDVQWRRKELTNAKTLTETPGSWIVVSTRENTGATLVEGLGKLERSCLHILTEGPYRQIGSDVFAIDSSSVNDWVRFFEENFRGEQKIAGIVDLSNLDAAAFTRPDELAQPCVNTTALVQALVRHGFRQPPRLFLVTRGAQSVFPDDEVSLAQTPILGLGKTIAMEHPELRCTRIDLPPGADKIDVDAVLGELSSPTPEDQIALRKGARYVARLTRSRLDKSNPNETHRKQEPPCGRPYRLEMDRPGVLSRLAHYEMDKPEPALDEVVIAVEAAGLNFIDVFAATEAGIDKPMIPDGQTIRLGHECAGKIVAIGANVADLALGDEVIALGKSALGSFFVGRAAFVRKKSASWNWDQAATLPISFLTAYYALEYLGRLRAGDRVLIHAGAGGVGLAAIQWAQHVGAEIFATAGSEEKRQYLRSIGVPHVFDSRSNEFVEGIKQVTAGEGVDVILNSLSGSLLTSSLSILADQGRFVDIGQRDSLGEQKTELRPFLRNSSFSRLDLLGLRDKRPEFVGRLLRELGDLFDKGVFRPLPVQPFALAKAKDAFEFMAQAKHIGKIALRVANAPEPTIVPLHPAEVKIVRPDATYLITGGLGGLGLSVASWLVERGARHLVLVGRRSPSTETQMVIDAMTKAGANVRVVSADISQENEVLRILTMIRNEMPALGGIIHSAAVLDDHTLLEQTAESFYTVFAAKAIGAWYLHVQTQRDDLDFFVMYSSAASLLGSPGQANYCAANAFIDALARERVRLGLPGMSIQWGAFAEVGLAAARESRSARLANRGMTALTPTDGLEILHQLLEHPHAEIGVLRLDIRQWTEFYPAATRLPFLTEILALEAPAQKDSTAAHQTLQKLQTAPPEERSWLLEQLLADQLGLVLQLDPSRIDRSAPLQSLGLDSLMSLELRNRLEALVGVKLPATVTFTYPTMEALARHLLSELGLEFALTPAPSAPSKEASHVDDLAHLTDDELLRAGKEILG